MGKKDIFKHCGTWTHLSLAKSLESQSRIKFHAPESRECVKRTTAEVKMAVLTASCNVPLAFHDKLSPTIRKMSFLTQR